MEQDIGIGWSGKFGPVLQFNAPMFYVDFKDADPDWFTNSLELMKGGTVGEANRQAIHERLDAQIDGFIKENNHG